MLLVIAGCTAEAAPSPPAAAPAPATVVPSQPMAGPYKSVLEACKAAPPCGFLEEDEQGNGRKPPTKPDCSAVKTKDDNYYEPNVSGDSPETAPRWLAKGNFVFAPVRCAVPEGLRASDANYYLYAKRADGWWRSSQRIVEVSFNEKYCMQTVNGTFKTKGDRTTFRFQVASNCVACGKQGNEDNIVDVLDVIDVPASPAIPVTFAPLITGEHRRLELDDDALSDAFDASDPSCKPGKKSLVLKETWSNSDTLVLSGAATWFETAVGADGSVQAWLGPKKVQSNAGSYTFKP